MALLAREETAPEHRVIEDVAATTMEVVSLATQTVVEGLASEIIEVGSATPIVAPVFVALKLARRMFDGVKRHREQLEELHDQCTVITTHVIIKCNTQSSKIDIAPLEKCVADLIALATRNSIGGMFAKIGTYRRDKNRIDKLRREIEALVPIMGLGGVVRVSEQLESVRSDIERIADAIKATSIEHKTLLVSGCSVAYVVMGIASDDRHSQGILLYCKQQKILQASINNLF